VEKEFGDWCKKAKMLNDVVGVVSEQKRLDGRTLVLERGLIQVEMLVSHCPR
jgi:hypothetical protein